jgi:glycosyltransferase involved in cell wall biosynthesis
LDPRIFWKECRSLAAAGFPVTLVAPAAPGGVMDGVTMRAISARRSRLSRMLFGPWEALRAGRAAEGRVFHLHDPELLSVGWVLKAIGCRVVYDAHEDVPRQVLAKYWIPRWMRGVVGKVVGVVERLSVKLFDGVVVATPTVGERFRTAATVLVRNYPIHQEFGPGLPYRERPLAVTYVGVLVPERGLWTMLEAAPLLRKANKATLVLAGRFGSAELERSARAHPGWPSVDFRGWLGRTAVTELLGTSRVGLVPLHPTPAYRTSLPVKMFEYMAAGVPVVASDFPLWRGIVEATGCGVLVEPGDAGRLAETIGALLSDPVAAEAMGRRGRQAVQREYSWEEEARTLVAFYDTLLAIPAGGGSHRA